MKMKYLFVGLVFLLIIGPFKNAQSQENETVTQKVQLRIVNEAGNPVGGVVVRSLNSNVIFNSDSNGELIIELPSDSKEILLSKSGFYSKIITLPSLTETIETISLKTRYFSDDKNGIEIPYNKSFYSGITPAAVNKITGQELRSYPTNNFMEALDSRISGLIVTQGNTIPGLNSVGYTIHGAPAIVYVDGVKRDASDLSSYEIDNIELLKNLSSRAALGISGASPVIWVTTRKGKINEHSNNQIEAVVEYGINKPTTTPKYLGAYDYARLLNEALTNDGLTPLYTNSDLENYKNHSDNGLFPDIDYYDRYVKNITPYQHANINFSGAKNKTNYFALLDYYGDKGFEKIGRKIKSDRIKLRANVNFPINDWIQVGVQIMGSYKQQTYPNIGAGTDIFNMYDQILSFYPPNATPIRFHDSLIVSSDYPMNLDNELLFGGHGESTVLASQNDVNLGLDLNRFVPGLSLLAKASFNVLNTVNISKGGTADLYRFEGNSLGIVQQSEISPNFGLGFNSQITQKVGFVQLNYNKEWANQNLKLDAAVFRSEDQGDTYQPDKFLDFSFRANYSFDNKYAIQLDVVRSGSIRLLPDKKFNTYPTIGVNWIVSNENFLKNNNTVNFLKLYSSLGKMGIGNFGVPGGFNPYYIYQTMWAGQGSWYSGIPGSSIATPITVISQKGNEEIKLPERREFDIGLESRLFNDKINFGIEYFNTMNTGLFALMDGFTPAFVGGGAFLPVTNFEKTQKWGFDGMLQFNNKINDFTYSVGVNVSYIRGKNIRVDESPALEDYRKRANKDDDLLWLYTTDGLFQDQSEIDSHTAEQNWSTVRPGDIRYVDFNNDGIIDEKDMHPSDFHFPRFYYGVNISLGYKGFNLFILGKGVADGSVELNSNRYFKINSSRQKYSDLMLQSWPASNDFPRMTTTSQNNVQPSTFWVKSATYLSIKNIELSYTFPENADKWKVFVRGSNLVTFSRLKKYNIDPTYIDGGITNYPLVKTITGGITIRFK